MKAADMKRVVGAAGHAISAVLEMRSRVIEPEMLNSAGSVSAEWYVETLWHYLHKRSLLEGISNLEIVFEQPARPADKHLHFALPYPDGDGLAMDFHVRRKTTGATRPERVPVARITVQRARHRRRPGVAPDPPLHPYGIEVRKRHLNSAGRVSWYTLVAVTMDVARRGAQLLDPRLDRDDPSLLYVVPRFTFTPLGDAVAQDNLFIYPEFTLSRAWGPGKTSAAARVTYWAVANDRPWPLAESVVTVVRTSAAGGDRRPVDDTGAAKG